MLLKEWNGSTTLGYQNLLPMKTAVDLWSNIITTELLSPHIPLQVQ